MAKVTYTVQTLQQLSKLHFRDHYYQFNHLKNQIFFGNNFLNRRFWKKVLIRR